MADRTLGLLLLALLAFALATELGLTSTQRALFALLVMAVPQLSFNLTFVLLPSALFLALVTLAASRRAFAGRTATLGLLLGAIAGAIATTKSTYLPHGVFFAIVLAILTGRRRGLKQAVLTVLTAALGCLLVMLPWMIASHATSGTWFYPSLGKGYQYSAYHLFPTPSSTGFAVLTSKVLPFCAPLLAILLAGFFLGEDDEQNDAIVALMAGTLIAAVLVGIGTGGDSVRRYNYPAIVPAILLLYPIAARRLNLRPLTPGSRLFAAAAVLLAVATGVMIWRNGLTQELTQLPINLRNSLSEFSIVPPQTRAEYAAMQAALPTDAAALASVKDAFLLNFAANSISIADVPGAASLPTGWPSRQDGEALARYLTAHHIRYLIYSYADFVYSDATAFDTINDPHSTQWVRDEHLITYLSHQQFAQLARTRRHLYDDGRMYILDLATLSR